MDVVKVALPENVCPVIKGGWEDVRWGGGEGAKKPVTGDIKDGDSGYIDGTGWGINQEDWFGPVDPNIEGDYGFSADWGFSGGDGEGGFLPGDTTGLITDEGWRDKAHEGGDSDGIITDGGWDARGDTNIPKHEVPKNGDDQYDASTEYGGIILKVDGSSWFGGTNEGITKTGSRIPVLWKDGNGESIILKVDGSTWFSGEGLLIDGGSDYIDADDLMGHTSTFIKAEKQIDQPRI